MSVFVNGRMAINNKLVAKLRKTSKPFLEGYSETLTESCCESCQALISRENKSGGGGGTGGREPGRIGGGRGTGGGRENGGKGEI